MSSRIPQILAFFSSLALVAAKVSADALIACTAISATGIETKFSTTDFLDEDYVEATHRYWSQADVDQVPACVVFPKSGSEVSAVVSVLLTHTDVDFAMKSGGHNPNVGFSSVDGGVLISFQNLADTVYSSSTQTAAIGPGARWGDVITALNPYKRAVVGGRIGDVGVGGYLLGGGLSFLSSQYGMACDTVVEYEVVLANATVVTANANTNTDLYWALKGGGNQFGIVSKFTMKTFLIGVDGNVWGGFRIYSSLEYAAIINATQDFTENYDDPKAAIIVTGEITTTDLVQIFVVFYFYDGPTPPAGVFDKFNAIPFLSSSTITQTYASLLTANNFGNLSGLRYLIRGITIPNLPGDTGKSLLLGSFKTWKNYVVTQSPYFPDFAFSIAFQPFPKSIPATSQMLNPTGNPLGLDPKHGDHIWLEYDVSWLTSAADKIAHAAATTITDRTYDYVKGPQYCGKENSNFIEGDVETESYRPVFYNDAMYDQDPLHSYGSENYHRLKAIQRKYDPRGFFPRRTGGFKFT